MIGKGISTPKQNGAERCSDVQGLYASWHYNWDVDPIGCPGDNVPMVWGLPHLKSLKAGTTTLGGNSEYVMGFNEPDLASQANMTADRCAKAWRGLEDVVQGTKNLVSPAPSGPGSRYLGRMYNRYVTRYGEPPQFHALACPSYSSYPSMRNVLDYMDEKADAWGVREIWVTEFGLQPPLGTQYQASIDYMHECISIFAEYEKVARFAWFTSRDMYHDPICCYRWATGEITPIGEAYRDL